MCLRRAKTHTSLCSFSHERMPHLGAGQAQDRLAALAELQLLLPGCRLSHSPLLLTLLYAAPSPQKRHPPLLSGHSAYQGQASLNVLSSLPLQPPRLSFSQVRWLHSYHCRESQHLADAGCRPDSCGLPARGTVWDGRALRGGSSSRAPASVETAMAGWPAIATTVCGIDFITCGPQVVERCCRHEHNFRPVSIQTLARRAVSGKPTVRRMYSDDGAMTGRNCLLLSGRWQVTTGPLSLRQLQAPHIVVVLHVADSIIVHQRAQDAVGRLGIVLQLQFDLTEPRR